MSKFTPSQQKAVAARGNVLVIAGAGAGKTRTLVERCLTWLLDPKEDNSLDQILMVTFTEAAATEMRKRLRDGLEKVEGTSPRVAEQLALLDTANICTLDSFCLRLVRQHFYDEALRLDPQIKVLPEEDARVMAQEALDAVLEKNYADESPGATAIQLLIQHHGRDKDQPIRDLILKLHHYTQTRPDPTGWIRQQQSHFQQSQPLQWREWLITELQDWKKSWLQILTGEPSESVIAKECAAVLSKWPVSSNPHDYADALNEIDRIKTNAPRSQAKWRKSIEDLFTEAEFLHSICAVGKTDPLVEDWNWVRHPMLALLDLTEQFAAAFAAAKRESSGVDFHDVEQLALRLLWANGQPTDTARRLQKQFRLIFVDEYQDINAAQDAIIKVLGGEGAAANRFLVGDVKQSIYRFRLADPNIFLDYRNNWKSDQKAQVIPLSDNFRSHEGVLHFVNAVFTDLMREEVGKIPYDKDARLNFGNPDDRKHLKNVSQSEPVVELIVRKTGEKSEDGTTVKTSKKISDTEMEARMIGQRLLELRDNKTLVWEDDKQRPMKWTDVVLLLRSPRNKVEDYVKEFYRLGIPLTTTRSGFYESLEIRDLLNLLCLLDNPLQDLPLLAVLHSPLAGLTADELATVRLTLKQRGAFWTALIRWHEAQKSQPTSDLFHKISIFLERYKHWRKMTRHAAISRCLEAVLNETHYEEWLSTSERGAQQRANVERLLHLTRQFDALQGQGLYRFLKFIEAQQDSDVDIEPASLPGIDAVRLMSIHQSKGLEFPIVVLPDLGKGFNLQDLRSKIILDEELGLCPQVRPPASRQFYPSLPYWLAQRRQKREAFGEELRLLYVALTRPVERLILIGTASEKKMTIAWPLAAERGLGVPEILNATSYLDWLGSWLIKTNGGGALDESGKNSFLSWKIVNDADPLLQDREKLVAKIAPTESVSKEILQEIRQQLEWRYPYQAAEAQPAKTSVSVLRRQATETDEESAPLFAFYRPTPQRKPGKLSASEIGSAHHSFLEAVSMTKVSDIQSLKEEAQRLRQNSVLTADETEALNFDALLGFWTSDVGRKILSHSEYVHREMPFTARFTGDELKSPLYAQMSRDEFVVVQGVMDLVVILPDEVWLLDFKTDHFPKTQLEEKIEEYREQLRLYALAVSRIAGKPVTKTWLHFLNHGETVSL